jgi:hypothetical protein
MTGYTITVPHTADGWHYDDHDRVVWADHDATVQVAELGVHVTDAVGRLIAEAPRLLRAVRRLVEEERERRRSDYIANTAWTLFHLCEAPPVGHAPEHAELVRLLAEIDG